MPVTREPTAVITDPPGAGARSCRRSTSGSSTTRNPSTLARIQPGRSTIAILPPSAGPAIPVSCRTGSCTAAASSRSSATTFLASARLTSGPGRAQRTPVEVATSQSIICALLTPPPYVPRPPGADPAATRPPAGPGSAAAAAGQLGRELVDEAAGLGEPVLGHPVGHERESQQLAVARVGHSGQRRDVAQVAGLGPDQAERRRPGRAEYAAARGQRPGKARYRQAGDHRPEAGVAMPPGQRDQLHQRAGGDPVIGGEPAGVHQVDAAHAQPAVG